MLVTLLPSVPLCKKLKSLPTEPNLISPCVSPLAVPSWITASSIFPVWFSLNATWILSSKYRAVALVPKVPKFRATGSGTIASTSSNEWCTTCEPVSIALPVEPAPELYNVLKSDGVSLYPCQIVKSSKLNPFSTWPNAEPPPNVKLCTESTSVPVKARSGALVSTQVVASKHSSTLSVVFPLSMITEIMCHWPSSGMIEFMITKDVWTKVSSLIIALVELPWVQMLNPAPLDWEFPVLNIG